MPHTHKKKFKNHKSKNESDITTKFKQKKRYVKSNLNQIIGGFNPENKVEELPNVSAVSNASVLNTNGSLEHSMSEISTRDDNDNHIILSEDMNKSFISTNTKLIKSNLKSNPFYNNKSTHVVENKKMYNFDTNYIMDEIKKLQLTDPKLMITFELMSKILDSKPIESILTDQEKQQTQKEQQKLHQYLCDFD
jgi:hypothetical protein